MKSESDLDKPFRIQLKIILQQPSTPSTTIREQKKPNESFKMKDPGLKIQFKDAQIEFEYRSYPEDPKIKIPNDRCETKDPKLKIQR